MTFSKPALEDLLVGLAVLGFAIVVGLQTAEIPTPSVYARVGPKAVPWAVTGLLGILGLLLTLQAFRGGWDLEREHGDFGWRSVGWLGLGLALNVGLIEHIGFILSSVLLFVCTARAFESRRPLRDAGVGFALATVAYIGFDRVLGYKIGTGIIESLI